MRNKVMSDQQSMPMMIDEDPRARARARTHILHQYNALAIFIFLKILIVNQGFFDFMR